MGRRSRTRRRSSGRTSRLVVAACVGLLLLGAGTSVGSFSTGQIGTSATSDVVDDPVATLALDNHSAMQTGETCKLADVTNNFDQDVTVTVSLRDDSTQYGNLTLGNGREGDTVEFVLAAGAEERVGMEIDDNSAYDGDDVFYHVNATGSSIGVAATDRHSTIDDGAATPDCDMTV